MKTDLRISPARLAEFVTCDPSTGAIFDARTGAEKAMSRAGRYGRLQVYIDGRMYYAARVVYALVHGEWPAGQVDHINGDHTDNRLSNLRVLTNAQNAQNRRRARHNNSTGLLGVSFDSRSGRYRARIMRDGAMRSLGYFATADEAHQAYLAAKRKLHPYWVEAA